MAFPGEIRQTKVKTKRYWPGKAPEWAGATDDEEDSRTANSTEKALVIVNVADPRLLRLVGSNVDNRDEVRANHRRIRQSAENVSIEDENHEQLSQLEANEENSETFEENRRRIREENLQRLHQKEAARVSDEGQSESEIEEEEEDRSGVELMKPVFIPKSERSTIERQKRLEAEQQALEESKKMRTEERKKETKQIIVDLIGKDSEIQKQTESEASDIDDEMINEAEEYEAHLLRKIARLKRDMKNREALLKEERIKWDWPKKKKLKFMQRDFHRGAFFQTQADDTSATAGTCDIYSRNYSAPTGDDKMDKTVLPKVMQVNNFGRRGRTKHTHLVNEDTTNWSNP